MDKSLLTLIFTDERCRSCGNGAWKETPCKEATSHTLRILKEIHRHYVCLKNCGIAGYKTEIYKLPVLA